MERRRSIWAGCTSGCVDATVLIRGAFVQMRIFISLKSMLDTSPMHHSARDGESHEEERALEIEIVVSYTGLQ